MDAHEVERAESRLELRQSFSRDVDLVRGVNPEMIAIRAFKVPKPRVDMSRMTKWLDSSLPCPPSAGL